MSKDNDKTIEKLVAKKGVHSGHRERMREKVHIDPEMRTFADHDMLEFQLSLVIPRRDTNKLAHDLFYENQIAGILLGGVIIVF